MVSSKALHTLMSLRILFCLNNLKGKIGLVIAQTEKLFGYSRKELLGKNVESLVAERFQSPHQVHRNS